MKIIHCADIHLDSRMHSVYEPGRARERRNEILNSFCRMVEYASENHVSAILICGDLFDTNNVSALTASTVRKCIENHPEISFYYIRGNHDEDAFLAGLEVRPDNLFTFEQGFCRFSLGESDRINLYGAELNGDDKTSLLSSFCADASGVNLAMLHGQECEGTSELQDSLDLRLLRGKNIDYLALGHVHAPKRERLDDRGIYAYCGCLEPRGFDEPGEHGFVILDINEETGAVSDTFVPFATRHMWEVKVDVTDAEDTIDVLNRIRVAIRETDISERDLVKIFLVGSFNVETEIETDFIITALKEDFYAFRVEDNTTPYIDYEKYRMDESLKGEFVRLCMNENLDEHARGEILHLGLTAIFGGEVR